MNTIRIHKQAGKKKDAIRINYVSDIPEFLRSSIEVMGEGLLLVCVEGYQRANLGNVIAFEKSDNTKTGWNTWVVGNAETNLVEKDGVFYSKATILEAEPMTEEFPDLLRGADIWCNDDGSWSYQTPWGIQTGFPGQAYWVKAGVLPNGQPDGYILTKSEETYKAFIVCDEHGNDIGFLSEIDP